MYNIVSHMLVAHLKVMDKIEHQYRTPTMALCCLKPPFLKCFDKILIAILVKPCQALI